MSETIAPAEPSDAFLDAIAAGTAPPEPEAPAPAPEPAPESESEAPEAEADAPEAAAEAPAEEEAAPEPEKPEEPAHIRTRIRQLTREKGEEQRARQLAERQRDEALAAVEALKNGQTPDLQAAEQARIERLAEEKAAQKLAAMHQGARLQTFAEKGGAEFPDFVDRCNTVAHVAEAIGEHVRPNLMAIIGEMDDGPRVVAHLADHAADAERILAKPPHLMALELAKISATLAAKAAAPPPPKPAPVTTKAPKPITPIGGTTAAAFDPLDDRLSMDEWMRGMDKRDAVRRKAGMRV